MVTSFVPLVVAVAVLCAPLSWAQTYTSNPGSFISSTLPPATDTITVGDQNLIADIDVAIDLTHTFIGDLEVTLSHNGVTIMLMDNDFGASDDLLCTFDDESSFTLSNGHGKSDYQPHDALSAFDNMDVSGDWEITVDDIFGGDDGTFHSWSLVVTPVVSPDLGFKALDSDGTVVFERIDGEGVGYWSLSHEDGFLATANAKASPRGVRVRGSLVDFYGTDMTILLSFSEFDFNGESRFGVSGSFGSDLDVTIGSVTVGATDELFGEIQQELGMWTPTSRSFSFPGSIQVPDPQWSAVVVKLEGVTIAGSGAGKKRSVGSSEFQVELLTDGATVEVDFQNPNAILNDPHFLVNGNLYDINRPMKVLLLNREGAWVSITIRPFEHDHERGVASGYYIKEMQINNKTYNDPTQDFKFESKNVVLDVKGMHESYFNIERLWVKPRVGGERVGLDLWGDLTAHSQKNSGRFDVRENGLLVRVADSFDRELLEDGAVVETEDHQFVRADEKR